MGSLLVLLNEGYAYGVRRGNDERLQEERGMTKETEREDKSQRLQRHCGGD